jgi:hypothetical protein
VLSDEQAKTQGKVPRRMLQMILAKRVGRASFWIMGSPWSDFGLERTMAACFPASEPRRQRAGNRAVSSLPVSLALLQWAARRHRSTVSLVPGQASSVKEVSFEPVHLPEGNSVATTDKTLSRW